MIQDNGDNELLAKHTELVTQENAQELLATSVEKVLGGY